MPSLLFREALLPQGWARDVRIVLHDGHIASVEPNATPEPADERHGIGLAGMPNLHSHAFQRGMAGLAERRGPSDDTFWTWREVMYRFALSMRPQDIEAVAAWLYVEMLEAGFTRVAEFHYLHHQPDGTPYANIAEHAERIAAAADTTGIGLTLLPVFYAHGGFGGAAAAPGQRRFLNDVDRFAALMSASRRAMRDLPGAVIGIAPHSLRAATPVELALIEPLAEAGPIHIHAAEQPREVAECLAWSGARPVEWLLRERGADARWCFIHATHMTAAETSDMARAGVVAGLCPLTEASLGDGIFNGAEYLAAGGHFGIGSDSHILIGVAEELRQLEYAQRLRLTQRNVMTRAEGDSAGRTLYEAALLGGAQACGAPAAALAPGAPADIVALDPAHPSLCGRQGDALLDGWIFAARGSAVSAVWVAGRQVVRDGHHAARPAVLARYRESLAWLMAQP